MKIKSLILCFMVFVTGNIVAHERDLFIKSDKSIVVKVDDSTKDTIIKDKDGFYIIPRSKRIELLSMGRPKNSKNKGPVTVSYNGGELQTLGNFVDEYNFASGKKLIIAPDTITEVFWGEDVLKLKLQSQASTEDHPVNINCDLVLNDSTIILTDRNLPFSNHVFVNSSKDVINIKTLKLKTQYDDMRDVVVTQIGDTITQLLKTRGKSLLSKPESLFCIQPGTKIQIAWGDRIWVIDSTNQSSIKDWIVKNLWLIITIFLVIVVIVVVGLRKYYKLKKKIEELLKSDRIVTTIFSSKKLLVDFIGDKNKGSKSEKKTEKVSQPKSDTELEKFKFTENIINELIVKITEINNSRCVNLDDFKKLCEDKTKIKEKFFIDKGTNTSDIIKAILDELEKTLSEESFSLNDKASAAEYVKQWLSAKWAEIQSVNNIDDIRNRLLWLDSEDKKEIHTIVLQEIGKYTKKNFSTIADLVQELSKLKDADVQQLLMEALQSITGSSARSIDLILKEVESNAIKNEFEGKTVDQINKIIGAYNKVEGLLDKYPADTSDELKAAIERSIIKEISERIQLDEECEKYDCLKDLIDSIKKSNNANELASGLFLKLHKISVVLNTLTTDKMKANQDKEDIEEKVVNEIKKQYKDFSEDELIADSPLNAIKNFVSRVKRVIDLKDKKISDLNADVATEKQMVEEFQSKLGNNQKALKGLYQSYTRFIVSTFEQIEKNVQQSCNASDKSSPLVKKINERIISNDSWGLSDFVEEMKKITDTDLNIDEMNEKIRSLFTRCLRFSSWIDILAQIYIYIQEPTLAGKLTALGLDTVKVNRAFVLTETMMSIVGIKLQYPKLFTDTFDEKCFEKESLSEIQDLVEDFRDLIDIRPGLIIDLIRVGYSFDETKKKAIVVIDM